LHEKWSSGPKREALNDAAAWKKVSKLLRKLQVALRDVREPGCLVPHAGIPGLSIDEDRLLRELSVDQHVCDAALGRLHCKLDIEKQTVVLRLEDGREIDLEGALRLGLEGMIDPRGPLLMSHIQNLLRDGLAHALVDHLVQTAQDRTKPLRVGGSRLKRVRDQDLPRMYYYRDLLRIWTRKIGGQLRFSRHPISGEPRGPLIRFLRAATGPVLGAEAPSVESLADAINREKRLRDRKDPKQYDPWIKPEKRLIA
jgi:hypothetical protein